MYTNHLNCRGLFLYPCIASIHYADKPLTLLALRPFREAPFPKQYRLLKLDQRKKAQLQNIHHLSSLL